MIIYDKKKGIFNGCFPTFVQFIITNDELRKLTDCQVKGASVKCRTVAFQRFSINWTG